MPAYLEKPKWKDLGSVVVTSLLSFIIIMTWLKCCKVIWWFVMLIQKIQHLFDLIFFFLVFMNYFQLLFELIILKVWLIVCLESIFWFEFLFFFLNTSFTLLAIVSSGPDFNTLLLHHNNIWFLQLIYYVFNIYATLYLIFKVDVF